MQESEKRVQAGFLTFNRFYQLTQGSKKTKTYEEFCNSSYYNAFVKFGSFINNVNPLYPDKFIDYVIKSGVKLDHWCRDDLYYTYLYEMVKLEPVESAVQRSLTTMMEWADEHNSEFSHYFNYVSLNRAVHDILEGKLSCWVVLNSKAGKEMINKMTDEQLELIGPAFDISFWMNKFNQCPADVALVKEILEEVKIL
ncbi:MAG: hypothetical protein EBV10_05630 [Synechococcaceae bacterium WB6_1A_059]|nr:hypothetical protein [Synechococcaceae bacterium WB6_1A_059]